MQLHAAPVELHGNDDNNPSREQRRRANTLAHAEHAEHATAGLFTLQRDLPLDTARLTCARHSDVAIPPPWRAPPHHAPCSLFTKGRYLMRQVS
jgi:hypothetical protein